MNARAQGCQGCGWNIRNDLADDGVERVHYCRICDPTGQRESKLAGQEDDSDDPTSVFNKDAERDSRALDNMLRGSK